MGSHAKCSPSAAERWLHCTAAPNYELQFPEEAPSIYAAEGTLAHEFAELYALQIFEQITKRTFNSRLKKLQAKDLYDPEMEKTAQFYAEYIFRKAAEFDGVPHLALEVGVDLSEFVPEGFGRCDCVLIGRDCLHITDYKHGAGVAVSPVENPQMMLYALGALRRYRMAYPTIETVSMAIVQPRITEDIAEYTMTADALLNWGLQIQSIAKEAYDGPGTFAPGDWCRWCKGKAICRARAEKYLDLEALWHKDTLTDAEIGDVLIRGEGLMSWLSDLQRHALQTILDGGEIEGWKAVEGRSIRKFNDLDGVLDVFRAEGYDDALLFDRKPKSLTELEKLMGKKAFAEKCAVYIEKPPGKPALAKASDKRPAYNSMAADAAGLV